MDFLQPFTKLFGEKSPHEREDMACRRDRPALSLVTASNLGKRSRSGTADQSTVTMSQSHSAHHAEPAPKRVKTETGALVRHEQQALPAAQEQVKAPSTPSLLPEVSTSSAAAMSSPGQPDAASHPSVSLSATQSPDHVEPRSNYSLNQQTSEMAPDYRLQLRDKLAFEFDLMIRRKHEELRLIELEQAKAQIALEQLRRCRLIPFPGQPGSTVRHDQMLDNTAPALKPANARHKPAHPASWGVTDGPYTRHYAKWLIPDPLFDSEQPEGGRQSVTDPTDSKLRPNEPGLSHRRQRQSTGGRADSVALDRSQATPKEKSADVPQIMKRADGQWVQLKCQECGKLLFKSVQGFMNHTRIQHGIKLKSHLEAATLHSIPVDGPNAPTPALQVQAPRAAVGESAMSRSAAGQVHPLVLGATSQSRATGVQSDSVRVPSPTLGQLIQFSPLNPNFKREKPATQSSFARPPAPSSQMPALSALVQQRGVGGATGGLDLQQMYTNASTKIDMDKVEQLVPDSEVEDEKPPNGGPNWRKPPTTSRAAPGTGQAMSGVRIMSKPLNIEVPNDGHLTSAPHSGSFGTAWSSSPRGTTEQGAQSPFTIVSNQDTQMTDLSPHTNPPELVTDHEDDDMLDDEAKSVGEHPSASGTNVRIFNDDGDHTMTDIPSEVKSPMPAWQSHQQFNPQQPSAMAGSLMPQGEKKRRGRPSKKGKEKVGH